MSDPAMQLPPGFRFHPTDEELILHYLRNRVTESPCPVAIIADVDIYQFDPWALPSKANYGDRERYFFTPRNRKYRNSVRPNHAAGCGYWKSTGTDNPVRSSATGKSVGVKKVLVFYRGRLPKGIKTNWIMHEYRLAAANTAYRPINLCSASMTMRLDDWVLCRICYRKTIQVSMSHHEPDEPCGAYPMSTSSTGKIIQGGAGTDVPPRMPSISELLNDECSLAQLLDDDGLSGHAEMARLELDQYATLLGHPIMNQFHVNNSGKNMSQLGQMDLPTGKRKRSSEEDGGHNGSTSKPAADK